VLDPYRDTQDSARAASGGRGVIALTPQGAGLALSCGGPRLCATWSSLNPSRRAASGLGEDFRAQRPAPLERSRPVQIPQ
jgi:hypothetical protein